MIEAKCSFNSVNKILIMISLIVLPIIVIITIFYFLNLKHNNLDKLKEEFETGCKEYNTCGVELQSGQTLCTDSITTNYNPITNMPTTGSITNTPSNKQPTVDTNDRCYFMDTNVSIPDQDRTCEIYFTEDTESCDRLKQTDSQNTCKFTFPQGWKEFKTLKNLSNNSIIDVPKKYIGKDGNNIPARSDTTKFGNFELETKCYKRSDGNKIPFQFDINQIVRKDCDGSYNTNPEINSANSFKLNGETTDNKYASINFSVYDGDNKKGNDEIFKNVLRSICSIKYNKISALSDSNLRFYKFTINSADKTIESIEKVRLSEDQTQFIKEPFNLSRLTSAGGSGISFDKYENSKFNFVIFQNTNIPNKIIDIFSFKYNYLCGNQASDDNTPQQSQIIEFSKRDGIIDVNNLFNFSDKIRKVNKEFTFEDVNDNDFNSFKNDESSSQYTNYKEQIKTVFANKVIARQNSLTADKNILLPEISRVRTSLQKAIDGKNQAYSTEMLRTNFASVCSDLQFKKGYYQTFNEGEYNISKTETVIMKRKYTQGLSIYKFEGYFWGDMSAVDNLTLIGSQIGGVVKVWDLENASDDIRTPKNGKFLQKQNGSWNYNDKAGDASTSKIKGDAMFTYVWVGYFKAPKDGTYRFRMISDDAGFFTINGTTTSSTYTWQNYRISRDFNLKKDEYYPIQIIWGEWRILDYIYFEWNIKTDDPNQWDYDGTKIFYCNDPTNGKVVSTVIEPIKIKNSKNNKVTSYYYNLTDDYLTTGAEYEIELKEDETYEALVVGGGGGGGRDGGGGGGGGEVKFYSDRETVQNKTDPSLQLSKGKYIVHIGCGGMYATSITANNAGRGIETVLYSVDTAGTKTKFVNACGGSGGGSKRDPWWDSSSGNSKLYSDCPTGGTGGEGHDWYAGIWWLRDLPNATPTGTASKGSESSSGYIAAEGGTGTPLQVGSSSTTTVQEADASPGISINITGVPKSYGGGGGGGTWFWVRNAKGAAGSGDGGTWWRFAKSGEPNTGGGGGGGGREPDKSLGGMGGSGVFILRKNIAQFDETDDVTNIGMLENVMLSGASLLRHPRFSLIGSTTTKKSNRKNITARTKESSAIIDGYAWKLFNFNINGYQNDNPDYNWYHSDGLYSAGIGQRNVWSKNENYPGEYIMIDLGYEIKLHSVKFVIRNSKQHNLKARSPGNFRIYATNNLKAFNSKTIYNDAIIDDKNWKLIYQTTQTSKLSIERLDENNNIVDDYISGSAGKEINSTEKYRCFALVVNELAGSKTYSEYLNFNEWILYEKITVTDDNNKLVDYQIYFDGLMDISAETDMNSIIVPENIVNSSDKFITVQNGNVFTYSVFTNLFLQKGSHKIIAGFTDSNGIKPNDLSYLSELYIVLDDKKYLLHGLYSEITSVTGEQINFVSYSYKPNKYLYLSESGFYKIYFRSYGYNYSANLNNSINLRFNISFDYKTTDSDSVPLTNIKNQNTFLYSKEEITTGLNFNSSTNGGSNSVSTLTLAYYRVLYTATNTNIFKTIYSSDLYTDTGTYKSDFTEYGNQLRLRSQYDTTNEINKKTKLSDFETDLNTYTKILCGESPEDSTFDFLQKYNNVEPITSFLHNYLTDITYTFLRTGIVRLDPKIRKYEQYKNQIDNINIQDEIDRSKRDNPTPAPCMRANINIFNVIKDSSSMPFGDESQNNMITIEKFPYTDLTSTGALPDSVKKSVYIQYFSSL